MTRLGCRHQKHELHNAGNDATFTLYVTLLLEVKWSEEQEKATQEVKNREFIQVFVYCEINEVPRWKPTWRAFGGACDRGRAFRGQD